MPGIGEPDALARLGGLYPATASVKEDTFTIRLVEQSQAVPMLAQTRIAIDELLFGKAKDQRKRGNIRIVNFYEARPAAAVGTPLTSIKNCLLWHLLRRNASRVWRRIRAGIICA